MAGGRAVNPGGGQWGREDEYKVRGERGQAGAHGDGLEPTSVLTAPNLDEATVLQEKLAGGLGHGAENTWPGSVQSCRRIQEKVQQLQV